MGWMSCQASATPCPSCSKPSAKASKAMRKKTFLYLSLVEIGGVLLTVILNKVGTSDTIWGIPFLITSLLQAVLFYAGLGKTYQSSDWGWFVAILFSTPLATLFYGILGPNDPPLFTPYPFYGNPHAIPHMLPPERNTFFYSGEAAPLWEIEPLPINISEQIPVTISEHPDLGR